jgi:hypothetical protein
VPSLDPDFAWIIERAIKRDPTERFATAQDFAEALDGWMRKNQLTETLSMPRPSDAFPTRVPSIPAGANNETLSPEDVEALRLKKTGTDGTWAHSRSATTEPGRRKRVRLATISIGGLLLLALVIAVLVKADPTPPTAASHFEGAASTLPAPPAAPLPSTTVATASSGSAPSTLAGVPGQAAKTTALAVTHQASSSASAPTANPEKPKPRPTTVSTKSFDLGY